jgi:hypothetical protein
MASPMTNASVLAILRVIAAGVGLDRAARRGIRDTVADACVGIAILSGTRGG